MLVAMFRDSDPAHRTFKRRCLVILEVKIVAADRSGSLKSLKRFKKPPSFCQTPFPWNLGGIRLQLYVRLK